MSIKAFRFFFFSKIPLFFKMGFLKSIKLIRRKCNFSSVLTIFSRTFQKFLKVFFRKWPGVYNIFFGSDQKNVFIKILLCYFYGLFLGYLFWEFIILHIGFSFQLTYMALCMLMILLGMFFLSFFFFLNSLC